MKQVMTRAWDLARNASKKFGGKAKDFLSQSLVIAWREFKKGIFITAKGSNRAREIKDQLNITMVLAEKLEAVEKAVQEYYREDDKLTFRVWRGIRVYFDCPFRSSYQNKKGNYYDIESGKLVDRYVRGTF